MNHLLRVLLITILLLGTESEFADEPISDGLSLSEQREVKISGRYVYYIKIAFDEYVKGKSLSGGQVYGDILYHVFSVRETDAYVVVGIQYDQARLRKEKNVIILGGSAEFYIEKGSGKIVKKLFFK